MVPLTDLERQYDSLRSEIGPAIERVLDSGRFVLGPELEGFESEFASYCGVEHAIGVNTGTSALHLALLAAGVGRGDEVITVPFTFVATVAAIEYAGARPVLVDVDTSTLTMDPDRVEAAITRRTRAIVPVHIFGQTADMGPILEIAGRHRLPVIEDACQAHGADYLGLRAGGMGELGCFSFYPGKNLGAYGEGGAVTTRDPEHARRIRSLRNWGSQESRYLHELKGFNYRLDELQAAILRVKLRHLPAWTEARRMCALRYDELLAGSGVVTPTEAPGRRHVYHIYAIRCPDREALRGHLQERGVSTGVHYPIPVHLQPAYADLGYRTGDFPVAEAASAEVVSLPIYAELGDADQQRVADAVLEATRPRAGTRIVHAG